MFSGQLISFTLQGQRAGVGRVYATLLAPPAAPWLVLRLGLKGSATWAAIFNGQLISHTLQCQCAAGGWVYVALLALHTGGWAFIALLAPLTALRLVLRLGLRRSAAWATIFSRQLASCTL